MPSYTPPFPSPPTHPPPAQRGGCERHRLQKFNKQRDVGGEEKTFRKREKKKSFLRVRLLISQDTSKLITAAGERAESVSRSNMLSSEPHMNQNDKGNLATNSLTLAINGSAPWKTGCGKVPAGKTREWNLRNKTQLLRWTASTTPQLTPSSGVDHILVYWTCLPTSRMGFGFMWGGMAFTEPSQKRGDSFRKGQVCSWKMTWKLKSTDWGRRNTNLTHCSKWTGLPEKHILEWNKRCTQF